MLEQESAESYAERSPAEPSKAELPHHPKLDAAAVSNGRHKVFARVNDEPIDQAAVQAAVDAPESGAVVVFHGVIRNHDGGSAVRALDYSAHPLAEQLLAALVHDEIERTGLRLAAWHRVGALQIGDSALVAAAASAHRREAFEAIEALVERIKAEIPIWKRQHYEAGSSEWVGL